MNEKAAYKCAPVLCFRGNDNVLPTVFTVVPHEEHSRHIYLYKCDDPLVFGGCVCFVFLHPSCLKYHLHKVYI